MPKCQQHWKSYPFADRKENIDTNGDNKNNKCC